MFLNVKLSDNIAYRIAMRKRVRRRAHAHRIKGWRSAGVSAGRSGFPGRDADSGPQQVSRRTAYHIQGSSDRLLTSGYCRMRSLPSEKILRNRQLPQPSPQRPFLAPSEPIPDAASMEPEPSTQRTFTVSGGPPSTSVTMVRRVPVPVSWTSGRLNHAAFRVSAWRTSTGVR